VSPVSLSFRGLGRGESKKERKSLITRERKRKRTQPKVPCQVNNSPADACPPPALIRGKCGTAKVHTSGTRMCSTVPWAVPPTLVCGEGGDVKGHALDRAALVSARPHRCKPNRQRCAGPSSGSQARRCCHLTSSPPRPGPDVSLVTTAYICDGCLYGMQEIWHAQEQPIGPKVQQICMLRWLASGGSGKRWEVEVSLEGVGKPMGERARVRLGEASICRC
jgi:hypothetical protein